MNSAVKVNPCKWTWYIDTLSWDIFKTTKYLPLNLKHGLNLCWVFIFTKVYQTRDKPKILRMNIDSTFSAWNVKCIYVMNCSAMLWILKRKRKKCFDSVSAAFFAAAAFFSFLLIVFCSLPPADSNLQRENCKSMLALTASLRSLLPGKLSLWMGDPWAGGTHYESRLTISLQQHLLVWTKQHHQPYSKHSTSLYTRGRHKIFY